MFVHRQVFHESWKGAVTSCGTKNNYFLCKAVHKVVSLGFFTLLFKCWYIQNYASWAPFNFLFINPNRKAGIHHTFPWQTPKSTFCFYTFHIHGTRDMGSRDQVIKKSHCDTICQLSPWNGPLVHRSIVCSPLGREDAAMRTAEPSVQLMFCFTTGQAARTPSSVFMLLLFATGHFFFYFWFPETGFLFSPGCPRICSVVRLNLNSKTCLPLPLECWD